MRHPTPWLNCPNPNGRPIRAHYENSEDRRADLPGPDPVTMPGHYEAAGLPGEFDCGCETRPLPGRFPGAERYNCRNPKANGCARRKKSAPR